MKKSLSVLFVGFLTAAALAAQGPKGPQGPGRSGGGGLDMSKVQVIQGIVSTVHIAYGLQYPSIVVAESTIKVAPVWFLLEKDFELKAGDSVKVTAAPARPPAEPYLHAVQIVKTDTNAFVVLRDESGVPLWTGGRQHRNAEPPASPGAGGIEPGSVATAAGVVAEINAGLGIQHPTMVLKVAEDKLISLKLGPERVLLSAPFEIRAGLALAVRYGKSICCGEYLALQLTNTATGETIVLRDDDGMPAW